MAKGILIKGVTMPNENGFVDLRVYGDGTVLLVCGPGQVECRAEEFEYEEGKKQTFRAFTFIKIKKQPKSRIGKSGSQAALHFYSRTLPTQQKL